MVVTLLYSIAGGMLAVLSAARIEQIDWKFLRLIGLLCLALACLAVGVSLRTDDVSIGFSEEVGAVAGGVLLGLGAIVLVLVSPWAARARRQIRVLCLVAGTAGLAACVLSGRSGIRVEGKTDVTPPFAEAVLAIHFLLGAWLLGSITIAWLLGHAYLTATKMTIAPLRHFSRILSYGVAVRIIFLLCSLLIAWQWQSAEFWTRLGQWWLIASLRAGVGLIALAVFAYMVADCVQLRSTQSATGILYFASVMAYVGELASQQLVQELGWPF